MARRISKRRQEMGEEAWAEYQKKRVKDKAKAHDARNVMRVSNWRHRAKLKLLEYKGGKCERCGYNKPIPNAYDFHHRDPAEKEFGIGNGDTRSLERMKKEADKCELVCRNCHAEIHYIEYQQQREETIKRYGEFLEEYDSRVRPYKRKEYTAVKPRSGDIS